MTRRLHLFRYPCGLALLIGILIALTSCAEGKAHLTIHRNGMADLSMTMALSDRALGLIGQPDLMRELAARLQSGGMDAESFNTDGKAGISATRQIDLKDLDRALVDLPEGIEVERSEEPHFFYTKQRVAVTFDMARMIGAGDEAWAAKLDRLPTLTKKLIQSQLDFDFLLTAPIKLGGGSADEIRDGGKTQLWRLKLFEPNRIESSVDVPNVRRIAYTAGIGSLVVLIGAGFGVRAFMRRRRGAD
ncbi:hypothetical protein ACF3MZ_08540 [Paenibacillaceae bacterium WGS1546]|uniref:hypothetical protein n=1 Tax=Cohnella sp. WGS1546 TaxID=3366810 RepID=UPI00372D37F5